MKEERGDSNGKKVSRDTYGGEDQRRKEKRKKRRGAKDEDNGIIMK